MQPAEAVDTKCPNLNGTFAQVGESLPGMPNYFMLRAVPYTIDVILGVDLLREQRGLISNVTAHQDNLSRLVFVFYDRNREISRREVFREGDSVSCEHDALVIRRVRESGGGEGGTGNMSIVTRLYLNHSGDLVITTQFSERRRWLFFRWSSPSQEYGARFERESIPFLVEIAKRPLL
jgi:hypothetical protein